MISHIHILLVISSFTMLPAKAALINRYHPMMSENAESVNAQRTLPLKMEVIASRNADAKMKKVAQQAIIDNFTGSWPNSGHESNMIGKIMEKNFFGYWMVGIFDAEFDVAYTIIRRSPAYIVYAVNDRTILIAKEGNGKPYNGDSESI